MKNILLSILLAIPILSAAQIRADIRQNQALTMSNTAYVFLNHATAEWDSQKTSLAGINLLIDFAKKNALQIIATVHGDAFINEFGEQDRYFISNSNVDYIMHSDGGAHRLRFPNAKALIVGGGNLHLCLCESIRDLVRGLLPLQENKDLFLVEEAIYDTDFIAVPKNEKEMRQFVSEFIFPNFPCPYQTSTGFSPVDLNNTNLKFYYHGKLLKELNENDVNLPIVSIHFEKWETVKEILNSH